MAIGGGKVLAVGSNEEIKRLAGPNTQLRDLNTASTGVFMFPGFNDAHVHLGKAGQTKLNVDLTGAQSLADDAGADRDLRQRRAGRPLAHRRRLGPYALGREDSAHAAGTRQSHRTDIRRFCSVSMATLRIANTAALKAAGITGKTVPPQGGAIDLDANGEPTGILRESAQDLVANVIPPPSHDERMRGDQLAIADALTHGVTSVQDNSDWEDFLVFEELEKAGKLNLRITEWLPFQGSARRSETECALITTRTIRCCTREC